MTQKQLKGATSMSARGKNPPGSSTADPLCFRVPLRVAGTAREFHISRQARITYGVAAELSSLRGTLLFADLPAIRRFVDSVNSRRGAVQMPLSLAATYAAAVMDEVLHLVIQLHRDRVDPQLFATALARTDRKLGRDAVQDALLAFARQFPTPSQLAAGDDAHAFLLGSRDSIPNREVILEEMLLLWLSNGNPALQDLKGFFDDAQLREQQGYLELIDSLQHAADPAGADTARLVTALQAPQAASPESLAGQLRFLRDEYGAVLDGAFSELLDQLLLAGDLIREEARGSGSGAGPAGPPAAAAAEVPTLEQLTGGNAAPRGYSRDEGWMPDLVLAARNCFVWLDQLSEKYGTPITQLQQIPDAELAELAAAGFTGLWLIGLWERSSASRRIKQLQGQPDAAASAYALHDYTIAAELGGDEALDQLRERAWHHGIRLASDMVPNHTGMDSRWIAEHPEWFIQLREPPYGSYSFNGPDLSADPRFSVYLEDHYYDHSDAAVVFKRTAGSDVRYIYHGNDGTALPWNDTAQLDYLQQEVREAAMQTILTVAARFPIIRFDAAMTLARQHIQRLWYPAPGEGGAVPSRSEHGSMAADVFEQLLPQEFWREVVDRVALEAPGTLLLAEAFWMMEGYFVRTLGMHRVYNSAFMNMLARQANSDFRTFLRNIMQLDPEILQRLVNYMSNPDEESAAAQFGTGDRYFGVALLLSTLPGLPMFGHGQELGLHEKYGMEFRRARLRETPDPEVLARHEREIFPLLRRRAQFAQSGAFELYDLRHPDGSISEDVIAYSNRSAAGAASLVLFNNHPGEVRGSIHVSVPRKRPDSETQGMNLLAALGFERAEAGAAALLSCLDHVSGLRRQLPVDRLLREGLNVELGPFEYLVLLDFELHSGPGLPAGRAGDGSTGKPGDTGPDAGTAAGPAAEAPGGLSPAPAALSPRESAGSSDGSGPAPARHPHDD
jgi:glycosidase